MADKGSTSVLARKLAVAGESDQGSGRSVLRALRLALARSAKDLFDLPLAVIGAKQARCEPDGAAGFLADDRLLMLLDGDDGLSGAASLDGACVAALIQQQTMGRVSEGLASGAALADRVFTGTDAALAEPLIEALLARAAGLADLPDDQKCLSGFRFGARVEDTRSLVLALEADRFRVFDLTIDIAEGAMQGKMCLLLPDRPKEGAGGSGTGKSPGGAQPAGLEQTFGAVRADLTATIGRLRIPFTELANMQPGDTLLLQREQLGKTELIAIDGQPVAAGRLGQINGLRALRLNETSALPEPANAAETQAFAPQVVAGDPDAPPDLNAGDQMTVDGSTNPLHEGTLEMAGLPVVVNESATTKGNDQAVQDDDNFLSGMTPEEAAAEISQLAGLGGEENET